MDIQKITNQFDIFLDTPHLSGLVALNAFVYGIPVVSFKNSNSYINIYSNELEVAFNHSFVSPTPEDYIQYVWDLCHKNDFYEKVREYQIQSKNIFKENQTKNINRVFFNTLNKINKKI